MKHPLRLSFTGLLACALLCYACGGGKNDGKENAAKNEPAAAPVALQPLDLASNGFPFSIKAPAGATIAKEEGSGETVVKKDRFNITIHEEKYAADGATAASQKEESLKQDMASNNNPELGLKMEVLKNEPTGYIYQITNKQGGKVVRFKMFVEKDGKLYSLQENFMDLNDVDKAMETGYAISQAEAETMYNAIKQ